MWLSSSSVGRKFVMAVTGACLVLFVTFHCLMNAIAICWPVAYNSICMFLGANWYALLASVVLAAFIVIHIIYAVVLTMKNRKARGSQRYDVSKRPATVEWSSNNMLVLGIVILAFLVVHLIQFWAKMQLQEIRGTEEMIPATAGTLFIQEAFSQFWTPIVYIIGFIALWFHMNHGFWSMFQSVGWDSTVWIPRLKKIGAWWTTIVILCFIAQAVVFTIKSHENYYKENGELRNQYVAMLAPMFERDFGPDGAMVATQVKTMSYEAAQQQFGMAMQQMAGVPEDINDPIVKQELDRIQDLDQRMQQQDQIELAIRRKHAIQAAVKFFDFLEGKDVNAPETPMNLNLPVQMQQGPAPQQAQPQQAQPEKGQPQQGDAKQAQPQQAQPEKGQPQQPQPEKGQPEKANTQQPQNQN